MIFCYITKTPCIAFDNDNHKIKETYNKWLKDCNYIKLLDESEIENINTYIKQITRIEKKDIDLIDEYKEIEEALLKAKGEYNEK